MIVAMGNFSSHSESMLDELVEGTPRTCIFLPAWSPFLNRIEEAFAEHKAKIKELFAQRHRETLYLRTTSRGAQKQETD